MADESNVKQPAPKVPGSDKTDTIAASVDNGANNGDAERIPGLKIGARAIFSGVSTHPITEGIAERPAIVTKIIDDVAGVAVLSIFTGDPTNAVRVAQGNYSDATGTHGTFRLVDEQEINDMSDSASSDSNAASTPATSKRGSANGG